MCKDCKGRGFINIAHWERKSLECKTCSRCHGSGLEPMHRKECNDAQGNMQTKDVAH